VAEPLATSPPAGERNSEVLHVIVRAEDDGTFFVRSPQVPGLAYGADSLEQLRAGLDDVLAFALDRPGPFHVTEHHERHFETAGREVVVRLAADDKYEQRREAYARLARAVSMPEQIEALLDAPSDVVGEILYLCAVPSDTVDWIATQLDPGGAATLAVAVADELLLTYRVHVDTSTDRPAAPVRHGGSETVADIMRTRPIVRPMEGILSLS
jgi:hypothetical protein